MKNGRGSHEDLNVRFWPKADVRQAVIQPDPARFHMILGDLVA